MSRLRGFLRRFRAGDPVARVCDTTHHNRVAQVLEDLQGMGCRIHKPTDGSPWYIIVDGTTDLPFPDNSMPLTVPPYEAADSDSGKENQVVTLQKDSEDKLRHVWGWLRFKVPS
jgi:hypothetical protein